VANLFRTLRTNLYQNRPSFVEDVTKTVWHSVYSSFIAKWLVYCFCTLFISYNVYC